MIAKLNLMKPLFVAGAVATAIAAAPIALADAGPVGPGMGSTATTYTVPLNVPGGSGCDENGNCGVGGQNGGPGGGPGGVGCLPGGGGCGSGGQNGGPGGVPGGQGCVPGVGCYDGHG